MYFFVSFYGSTFKLVLIDPFLYERDFVGLYVFSSPFCPVLLRSTTDILDLHIILLVFFTGQIVVNHGYYCTNKRFRHKMCV